MYLKPTHRFSGNKNISLLAVILMLLFVCYLSFSTYTHYNEPTLVGKWKSLETKENVTFTADGIVLLENTEQTGHYKILSPSKLEYSISGRIFIMYYHLEGRKLSWGVDKDEPELFVRKSIFN